MNKLLILLLTFYPFLTISAQFSELHVFGVAGSTHNSEYIQIDYTIGEVMIESFNNGSHILTQGFHQSNIEVTVQQPMVVTSDPVVQSVTNAMVGGNVINNGGAIVTDKGVYWGTDPDPIINGLQVSIGAGTGLFSYIIENLDPATNYYVAAYAVNSEGVSYGEVLGFSTILLPKVTTANADEISDISAAVGGEVTCNGGIVISSHGVYWGIDPDPVLTGSQLIIGDGTGFFSHVLENLVSGTTYFIIAYATNDIGTAYGEEISFTTLSLPEVITNEAHNISESSALVGGEVIFDGLSIVISRGVYWSTDSDPEISGIQLLIGDGTGQFSQLQENLEHSTTYYIKAFATNSVGTAYGNLVIFETLPVQGIPPLLWIDDLAVTSDQDTCFSAYEIITVAGNGNFVDVNSGGSLLLVAGEAIRLLDGFRVFEGGNFEAWIDTNGDYCTNPKSILAITDENTTHQQNFSIDSGGMNHFKVFPNPTSGTVTLELSRMPETGVTVEIFSMLGEVLYKTEVFGERQYSIDLTVRPKGIYIFRVSMDNQFQIEKVVKK